MATRKVELDGPAVRGTQVGGALLRDLLTVFLEGSQRALRIRTQGRSTARGVLPNWILAASDFSLRILEGSTVVELEAPSLLEAAPDEFRQAQLFPEIDPARPAFDYLVESLEAAVEGDEHALLYDRQFLKFLGKLDSVFVRGIERIDFPKVDHTVRDTTIQVTQAELRALRALEAKIPRAQHVKVTGKLDTIRHSDRTFTLKIGEDEEQVRGIAEQVEEEILQSLWGQRVLVAGTAHFTARGAIQRIEADAVRSSSDREDVLFSLTPTPIGHPAPISDFRRAQGPRSGLHAIFGRWPGEETDEEIRDALDSLS